MFYIDRDMSNVKGNIIVIEGNISAGKSTFGMKLKTYIESLSKTHKCKFFEEYRNDVLLSQYISDMKRYSYSFQLFMLSKRIQTYKEAIEFSLNGGISIIDRSIIGDYTFCKFQMKRQNISQDEFNVYCSVLREENLLYPHYIIYLDCDVDICLQRIKQRGLSSEIDGYDRQYIQDLNDEYKLSLESIKTDNNNVILTFNNNNFVDVKDVYNMMTHLH